MIEDLDGAESRSSRGGHVRAVSIALIAAAVVGFGALSRADLRGPFATPDPNARAMEMLTSKTPISVARIYGAMTDRCDDGGHFSQVPAFVARPPIDHVVPPAGQAIWTAVTPLTTTVYSPDGKTVIAVLWQSCASDVKTDLELVAR